MECVKCHSKWEPGQNASKSFDQCPFCGTSLLESVGAEPPFDNSRDALVYIMKIHGVDVLHGNRLNVLLTVYAPTIQKGKKRVILSAYSLGAARILYEKLDSSEEERQVAFKQAVAKLVEDGNAQDLAVTIVLEFTDAIGWEDISLPLPSSIESNVIADTDSLKIGGGKMNIVIDIGGSGAKLGIVKNGKVSTIIRENLGSLGELSAAIMRLTGGDAVDGIGLSVPGTVRNNKLIRSWKSEWLEGETDTLIRRLTRNGSGKVFVLNDGEAHALALRNYREVEYGAFNLAIGSGVAFGVLDDNNNLLRSLSGDNWEIGDYKLNTRDEHKEVWYALGKDGFENLRNNPDFDGRKHFGHRLGSFVGQIALLFRPKTVGLSGGIIRHNWHYMEEGFLQEFNQLDKSAHIYTRPKLVIMHDEEAALSGLATLF